MAPLAASAFTHVTYTLVEDEKKLAKEEAKISLLDEAINKERGDSFRAQLEINNLADSWDAAVRGGDTAKQKSIEQQVKSLAKKVAAEDRDIVSLSKKEAQEVALEEAEIKQVNADKTAEIAQENKELLQAEEAVLKRNVDDETGSFISKFFKQ